MPKFPLVIMMYQGGTKKARINILYNPVKLCRFMARTLSSFINYPLA